LASLERHYTETHNYGSAGAGGRFGGVTTVVIGYTKNLSTQQQTRGFGRMAFSAFITPVRGITRVVEIDGLSE
jgi:hypothetical protein